MADADDITAIEDAAVTSAVGPKKVQSGEDSIEQHSLTDQVKLSEHLRARTAPTTSTFCGIGVIPTIPPAAG